MQASQVESLQDCFLFCKYKKCQSKKPGEVSAACAKGNAKG